MPRRFSPAGLAIMRWTPHWPAHVGAVLLKESFVVNDQHGGDDSMEPSRVPVGWPMDIAFASRTKLGRLIYCNGSAPSTRLRRQ
jgi:hypothetical protein